MIRVFGITGTNGKTTVSWMLRNILEHKAPCGLIGTIEYITGKREHLPCNTTPGRELLYQLFDEMEDSGIHQCIMEVSSHGIDQRRTDGVEFSIVGFTNLTRDHLDYHGSMEEYYHTKKKLFLKKGSPGVINIDDVYGMRLFDELAKEYPERQLSSCSLERPAADYYCRIISCDISGTDMEFFVHGESQGNLKVKIPGRHFAEDALLAAAMALQSGSGFKDVKLGIEKTDHVPGRMECVGDADDTLGIVDYAHTPDSMEKLLRTVSEMCRGRLICVFGCGGFRDKGKRILMGEAAGRYSDYCIITNDNPRGEPPENIALAIEEGVHGTGCGYSIILDRYQAVKRAVSLADKWDIIVVTGKGHENYQVSGDRCIPFNDKEVLKELLEKKYEKTYDERNNGRYRRSSDKR